MAFGLVGGSEVGLTCPLLGGPAVLQRPVSYQALFEKLFASSPDGILVVDNEGRILEANPQVESLFGYTCSELLGSPVEILIPERFRQAHNSHRTAYSNQPNMRSMGSDLELYAKRKDGSEFPVDIMLSPVQTDEGHLIMGVVRDITERKRSEDAMRRLALSDPLTGLGNYRRLQIAFEAKWSERTVRPLALLLLDIDGLKKTNDTRGHLAGNSALCRLADVLLAECRAIDSAVRHGGDEFAVILPEANAEGAKELATRLAGRLANEKDNPPVSFSYGVGVYLQDGTTLNQRLGAADSALYAMKKSRR